MTTEIADVIVWQRSICSAWAFEVDWSIFLILLHRDNRKYILVWFHTFDNWLHLLAALRCTVDQLLTICCWLLSWLGNRRLDYQAILHFVPTAEFICVFIQWENLLLIIIYSTVMQYNSSPLWSRMITSNKVHSTVLRHLTRRKRRFRLYRLRLMDAMHTVRGFSRFSRCWLLLYSLSI